MAGSIFVYVFGLAFMWFLYIILRALAREKSEESEKSDSKHMNPSSATHGGRVRRRGRR